MADATRRSETSAASSHSAEDTQNSEAYQEELAHLQQVTHQIEQQLAHLQASGKDTAEERDDEADTADVVAERVVAAMRAELLNTLSRALAEPYFGRLDFAEHGAPAPEKLYIGKRGIQDLATGERIVIDWRAPVASLFYTFSGQGETAAYDAPEGRVEGVVHLKRNIVIRHGRLQRVVDSYVRGQENLGVADEFLLYRLSEHKDSRLRDIVSTIQAEQDKIIRADRNQAIVIQGVAGSGKTTVALHRLAYLLYQYADRLRPERMVIFAPNAMFVDYISEVLPELGVGGIQQTTFARWALAMLDHQVKLRDDTDRLDRWFAVHPSPEMEREYQIVKYKGSVALQKVLDVAVAELEETFVPDIPFSPWEGAELSPQIIREWFTADYRHYPLLERKQRVLARVKRWYETLLQQADLPADARSARKKQAASRFRAYAQKWPDVTAWDLYRALMTGACTYAPKAAGLVPDWLIEYHASGDPFAGAGSRARSGRTGTPRNRAAAKQRMMVRNEDLAPIMYLQAKLNGVRGNETFDHIVIDEAQDFSPLQIALLQLYCPQGSFTILGDLSQSIHSYQGIDTWGEFQQLFPPERSAFFQLDVSYRSTMEIIEFANAVAQGFPGFVPAKPVFRSGHPVQVEHVAPAQRFARAAAVVEELRKQHDTVAIICRTDADCDLYHAALQAANIPVHRIGAQDERYEGGISVLPVYLAKGLEFDAVLLVDVNAEYYDARPLSAKLLFVGCTRALHRLWVQYTGTASPLLPPAAQRHMYGVGEMARPLSRTS